MEQRVRGGVVIVLVVSQSFQSFFYRESPRRRVSFVLVVAIPRHGIVLYHILYYFWIYPDLSVLIFVAFFLQI